MTLTPPEHEHNALVETAAMWLADQNPRPKPIIPVLRQRFNLSALEAIEAAGMSERFRMCRRAFG
ncbi:hypothetical protein [Sinorhizobium fredii]|uniref:hypothetical protein n=1 Tax=Rhizobium fredii TaxID=380 RepID=UPI0004B2A7BA|nr:hypothetical protein [Sinorhizobium fredii]AWI58621.1 hypothetical protein AB395_00002977 [Sinorhizobium fredii CCBAU 45436]